MYAECVERFRTNFPENESQLNIYMNDLARIFKKQGKFTLALDLYQACFSITRSRLGDDHPDTLICGLNLSSCQDQCV